jgi:AcrR family transcriptional regulator
MVSIERKERERQLRREDILNAAERVFAARGFHAANVSEIAKEAQYATGTVYLYFKDKEDIYRALIEKGLDDFLSCVQEKTQKLTDPVEKLRCFLAEKFRFFQAHRDFFKLYIVEGNSFQSAFTGEKRQECLAKHMRIVEISSAIIREGQQAGIFKPFDPKELAFMFGGLSNYLMMKSIFEDSAESIETKTDLVMDVFLKGCSAHKKKI